MKFRYFLAQNQIEDYEDICLLMLNEEGKQVYHIIARLLNISKYSSDLVKEFEDKYIEFFEREAFQVEGGLSIPREVAWDLKDCLNKEGRIVDDLGGIKVRYLQFKDFDKFL